MIAYLETFEHNVQITLDNSIWQISYECGIRGFIWKRSAAAISTTSATVVSTVIAAKNEISSKLNTGLVILIRNR